MKKLFRFYVDYGRNGSLEGLFVSTEKELDLLNGTTIHFGEAFGKHSEVWLDDFNWRDCCKIVSDDVDKIDWLVELLGYSISGYCPEEYFYIEETSEYQEGYEAESRTECEYDEGTPEYLRWMFGHAYKLEDELKEIDEKVKNS